MSTVAEINEAIEKLDVPDQVRLLQHLPEHLKIKPGDILWPKPDAGLTDAQATQCYQDGDWAALENGCGKASD